MEGRAAEARPDPSNPPTSPVAALSGREIIVISAVAIVLSLAATWPLILNLTDHFPAFGYGDPYITSWFVAWDGYALIHQPLHFFEANTFWPLHNSLAMSEATLGYAPIAVIGSGATAAVVRYNLLFIFTFALAFVGAYLLARELKVSPVGAAVGAAIFGFAPFKLDQATHLQVISSGGIPLALFLLLRGYKSGRWKTVLAGWLVATWQLSIAFGLGVPMAYLLGSLGLIALFVWLARGRPALPTAMVRVTVVGVMIFVAWGALQAAPYLRLTDEFPQGRRTEAEAAYYSPPPRGLLAAPVGNRIWGPLTESFRSTIERPDEKSMFPGVLPLVFAIAGLGAAGWSVWLRFGLGAGVVTCTILSLGYGVPGGRWLFGALFRYFPGWQAIRTPGRLITFTTLGLALLGSIGAERMRLWLVPKFRSPRAAILASTAVAVLALATVVEGTGNIPQTKVLDVPPGQVGVPGPQLHLPSNEFVDRYYMFWSTEGFPDIANGEGAFDPPFLEELNAATANFPDQASIDFLRSRGITSVVYHPGFAAGTPWEQVPTRSIEGLPVTRTDQGGVIVYEILP
jgi:hypothetical protein